jgi:predicted unusual protein kinase regulating ubiquinone biosynthesis (AarF/ABC1/UbiB family)
VGKKPPKGPVSRVARLAGLTTRVGGAYVKRRVAGAFQKAEIRERAMRRLNQANAERIVETMGRLKGAAMKVGQAAAMMADHLDLSPEVRGVLGKLHADVEPLDFATIKSEIEASLEESLEDRFASFDPSPIGTASLGQVHGATLPDGSPVVVKVLHKGIENGVAGDLAALKSMLIGARMMRRTRAEVDAIFAEIRERLDEELDYLQEAANLAEYRRLFAGDDRVRIPAVHPGWSTDRVLTMDRLDGVHVEEFVASASAEALRRAGQTLGEIHYKQAFELRTLHADPHPGNYLFEADGRIGLLDFGCIKRFDEFWIGAYARTALAAFDGDRDGTIRGARDAGVLQGDSRKAEDALWAFCQSLIRPYRMGFVIPGGEHDDWMGPIMDASRSLIGVREIQVPRNIIYLHRALVGNYNLLRRLKAGGEWGVVMRRYCEHAVAVAEGRPSPLRAGAAPPA